MYLREELVEGVNTFDDAWVGVWHALHNDATIFVVGVDCENRR